MKNILKNINSHGFAGIIALLTVCSLVLILTFSLGASLFTKKQISRNLLNSTRSYYMAETGIEDAVYRKIKNLDLPIISANFDGASVDQTYTTTGDETTVESVSNYGGNFRKLKTVLKITTSDVAFHYGVQVGEGGLTMGNGSSIDGNIYSDGTITGNPGATITGDAFVATGMSLDRSYSVYNSDENFGKASPVLDIAQSFSPTVSGVLSQVSFYIKEDGNPADRTIYIVDDDSGSPAKTLAGGAPPWASLDADKIGSSYGWVDFSSFSTPPNLTLGQTYWIIIDTVANNSKYFTIGRDNLKGNTNGVSKYSADWSAGSPVWVDDAGDFDFKVWMGGVATSLNSVAIGGNAHAHSIVNSDITGDAYYQTISGSSVGGASYPGSPDPAVEALPISSSNIIEWEADAININPALDTSLCTQTVDVTINGGVLNCDFTPDSGITITLNGTLWVKGNITLGVGTHVILGSGYGTSSGVIIADKPGFEATSGKILTENLVVICGSQGVDGSSCYPSIGSYILMLSTHSGAATYAVDVRNNTNGAIFYAHQGTAHINNGADLKEVTAYKLELAPTAAVTYESGLASAAFTSGPGGGWEIISWNETQ